MRFFYLSFATKTKFLGGCVVRAPDLIGAVERTTALGINPGGEVAAWDVTEFGEPPYPLDTIMSQTEMAAFDGGPGANLGQMSEAERGRVESHIAGVVCEECNPEGE